jgi:hypothetical protein
VVMRKYYCRILQGRLNRKSFSGSALRRDRKVPLKLKAAEVRSYTVAR